METKGFLCFYKFGDSVFNFVSLSFHLIPEAGCGQSPQALINAGFLAN